MATVNLHEIRDLVSNKLRERGINFPESYTVSFFCMNEGISYDFSHKKEVGSIDTEVYGFFSVITCDKTLECRLFHLNDIVSQEDIDAFFKNKPKDINLRPSWLKGVYGEKQL